MHLLRTGKKPGRLTAPGRREIEAAAKKGGEFAH
jgi:hypothetical protein